MTHSVQTGSGRTFIVPGCCRNTLFVRDCNENELVWSCRNHLFAYTCHGNKSSSTVIKKFYIFGLSHRLFIFVFLSSGQIYFCGCHCIKLDFAVVPEPRYLFFVLVTSDIIYAC